MLKVYKTCCQNCLLSPDRIVSPESAKRKIAECKEAQAYFICHTASMEGEDIVCKAFYDKLGHVSKLIQFAKWIGSVEFVERTESKKLPTYREMNP